MTKPKKRRSFTILLRRIHLYAGLFLLPWVFLYGITGAMYNHQGLLPEATIQSVPTQALESTPLMTFPDERDLAAAVVEEVQSKSPDQQISLAADPRAALTGDLVFQWHQEDQKHTIHLDPIGKQSRVVAHPNNPEAIQPLLTDVRNIQLKDNPYTEIRNSVPGILQEVGIEGVSRVSPQGYCKLNFLANLDDTPVRVTYVLRDGHIDVSEYRGEDGMTPRSFFMRLHTTHGQSPYWNGRMYWSVILDIMAIAMVTWGLTGLVMWWQIRRTRRIGALMIVISIGTFAFLFLSVQDFYAVTRL